MIKLTRKKCTIFFTSLFLFSLNLLPTSAQNIQSDSSGNQPDQQNSEFANFIIRKAIDHKDQNRLSNKPFYQCERYEKLNMGWINLTAKEKQMLILKYFKFLFENTDSTDVTGKTVDFILSKETLEDVYYRKSTHTKRSVVKGINKEWVYTLLHEQGLRSVITEFLNDYSIYDNEMTFLSQKFVSPLSSSFSRIMYDYDFSDTVRIDGILCYKIDFKPKNEQFLAFKGSLYIADSTFAVAKSRYYIYHNSNLNFIDTIGFRENYIHMPDGSWVIGRNETSIEMSLFKLFARRINSYIDYKFDSIPPAIFDKTDPVTYKTDAWNKPDQYWVEHRHFPFTNQEEKARAVLSKFVSGSSSGPTGFLLNTIFNNYLPLGKFDIGPIFSTVSSNDIEGLRLRLGGATNAKLNPHFFLEGYGAYGFKDEKWKYALKAIYSFPKRESHPYEFPANSLSLSHTYDLRFPGQELINIDKDNVFLSWRRAPLDRMLLERKSEVLYKREFYNGISYSFWGNNRRWEPVGAIEFNKRVDGAIQPVNSLTTTEFGGRFRFALGERFYQSRNSRMMLSRFSSAFTFGHAVGIKKIFGGEYAYNLTEMSMQHAQSLSAFGYVDMMFKAGKQWSKVPYPLLIIPQANQSYITVPETYNLMNILEFACDKYASFSLDYHMNGLLFNWLPVNRVLKLREVATFKSLIGSLSDYNNPAKNQKLSWAFPVSSPLYPLEGTPYMEAGVGLENIFSLIRLDYVWRLTYRNHPDIDKSGIRVGLKLQF